MKKVLQNVSFVFLLLKMCFVFGQGTATQKIIIIDPGHGGKDSGAIGVNGIKEKDIVLEIAKEILNLNARADIPLNIYLTRYGDTLISLPNRIKLAKELKADLFISLHGNHSNNPDAKGTEVYIANQPDKFSRSSIFIGYEVEKALVSRIGFKSRGVRFANFQVLREMVKHCPSILVEIGFVTNKDEADFFLESSNLNAIALALFTVMRNHFTIIL